MSKKPERIKSHWCIDRKHHLCAGKVQKLKKNPTGEKLENNLKESNFNFSACQCYCHHL